MTCCPAGFYEYITRTWSTTSRATYAVFWNSVGSTSNLSASSSTRRSAACAPPVPSRSDSPSIARDWISGGISSPGSGRSMQPSGMRCTVIVPHKASRLNPHEIGALVALVNQDRLGDAELAARKLLTLHPGAGMLWKILSVALVRQGKDALQALQKTTELMPEDSEAHRNLGAELTGRGQCAHGLESLRRARALSPHDADCLVTAADAIRALCRAQVAVPL